MPEPGIEFLHSRLDTDRIRCPAGYGGPLLQSVFHTVTPFSDVGKDKLA